MKPLKRQWKIFVDEMVKHGDHTKAYQKAYPSVKESAARVNGYRLLQNATIASAIKVKVDKIEAKAQEKAAEELKDKIVEDRLTREEKLSILAKIARGEHQILIKKPVWDKVQQRFVFVPMVELPDHVAIMKALELESRMTGDFAPEKHDHTTQGERINTNTSVVVNMPEGLNINLPSNTEGESND